MFDSIPLIPALALCAGPLVVILVVWLMGRDDRRNAERHRRSSLALARADNAAGDARSAHDDYMTALYLAATAEDRKP